MISHFFPFFCYLPLLDFKAKLESHNFCVQNIGKKKYYKNLLQKLAKVKKKRHNEQGEWERDGGIKRIACNYSPLKPMIWMVIFRLSTRWIHFISCNLIAGLGDEQNFRCVCARWSQSRFFFPFLPYFRAPKSIGMLEIFSHLLFSVEKKAMKVKSSWA